MGTSVPRLHLLHEQVVYDVAIHAMTQDVDDRLDLRRDMSREVQAHDSISDCNSGRHGAGGV